MDKLSTRDLIKKAGGPVKIAAALGITKQAASQWEEVPADQAIRVAEASGWLVTPHELRPDLYPNEADGLPCKPGTEATCG